MRTGKPHKSVAKPKGDSEPMKPLNFRVPADFHREFKTYAASHGMSMLDLLRNSFECIKQRNRGA